MTLPSLPVAVERPLSGDGKNKLGRGYERTLIFSAAYKPINAKPASPIEG